MSDDVTTVLNRATPSTVDGLDYEGIARRGRRRRWAKRATSGVVGVASVVALAGVAASILPTDQPQIEPLTPSAPAPNVVEATDGAVPMLPADAEPVDMDLRPLPDMGPDVRGAAVAADGRVAVSATRRELAVAHPDGRETTQLSIPETIERCGSIAFDATGDLWALCHVAGTPEDTFEASLLRYRPDETEPTSYDVTGLIREATPSALYAHLWIGGEQVRAVAPTGAHSVDDQPPSAPADATAVTLVDGGELQNVEDATITALPRLPVDVPDGWVGAGAGQRTIGITSPGSTSLQISWLTHETTVTINTPTGPWDLEGTNFGSAFLGSTLSGTYYVSSSDRTIVYGIAADGHGTTSVMRLPSNAQGMPGLPDRPSPILATLLLPAPDGSIHLLIADESSLSTAQVLPATR